MSEFAGLVRLNGEPVDESSVARLARSVRSQGKPVIWRADSCAVFVEGRAEGEPPPTQSSPGTVLLVDAWLDSPAEAALALGLDHVPGDRALCAAACAKWGVETAAQRLSGDFVFAHWDEAARRLTLARDALGGRPIFYVAHPHYLLFATTLQTMLAMPETPRDLDELVVAHTMTIALQDQEQTIYRHIRRAPPGGVALFERGQCRTSRWFTHDRIAPVCLSSDQAYVEAAREHLDRAVRCRLPAEGPFVSQLSGGFDSAGVTATAARLLGGDRRLSAYTRVAAAAHPDEGFDERALAGLLVDKYPNIDWKIVDDARESPRDIDPESEAGALLVPRLASFNATWFESLFLAVDRSGARVMLTGASGNLTLSHGGEPRLVDDLKHGRWRQVAHDLRGSARLRRRSLPHVTVSALYQAFAPRSVKRWRQRSLAGGMPWLAYSVVSPDFLADLDYAAKARELGHDVPFSPTDSSRQLRLRLLQGQRGFDFRGFTRRKWTVETRDPYRDRRLVEFCLGIPEDQYWREGQGRWLARRVLADRVPAETLAQLRRGRQSPEWYTLATRRRDGMAAAIDRIARSPLASRVIDVKRMRALLDDWPSDADAAHQSLALHGHALQRAISMGGFLRWHEGRND